MYKDDVISKLTNIISTYGNTELSFSKISTELGIDDAKLVKTYGELVTTGIYNLPDIDELINRIELLEKDNKVESFDNSKVTTFHTINHLIPSINPKYVPFGCYNTILRIVSNNSFLPAYIVGESGGGKSESIRQACAKAKRELVYFNATNETTEEDLIGSFILEDGNMLWKDGPVLVAMRRGAVLLLDEIDQLPSSSMSLQSILQNEPYYIKKTNEIVTPKDGFTIIGTANTKGDGDGGDRFIGANVLNEAFLERFNVIYEHQYPPLNVEMKILQNYSSDNKFCAKLVRWSNLIRKSYYDGSIPRCITTRRLIQILKNVSVLQNEKDAITFALNRFEKHVHEAMLGFFEAMSSEPFNDGLDELAGTAPIISDETKILFNKINNNSRKLLEEDEDNDEFVKSLAKKHLSNSPSKGEILKELQSNSNYI